ncbi:MAG: ABC transporter ATP-binding protein [Planctomycetes bacterium]|nr:ABC transporter ATP-binding protein [Planctomycetota bacterium]
MIRLVDVWRSYSLGGQELHALAGVTEDVLDGEHVAVMGPSGSGKSTLLNVIGLLDRPTRGRYELDGREVSDLDDAELSRVRRDRVGHVFQAYHLVARLDAQRNVELPMLFAGVPRAERHERARAALAEVGLAKRSGHRPSELSGGERQRVAIARATVLRPTVILADEPTGNLDRAAGQQVLELLERLNHGGTTLMVVTHDLDVARRARRVLILEDGRVVNRLAGHELKSLAEALAAKRVEP